MSASPLLDFLFRRFEEDASRDAVVWKDKNFSYRWLLDRIRYWMGWLSSRGVAPGAVVFLEADYTPNSIALFLALTEARCILVPFAPAPEARRVENIDIADPDFLVRIEAEDTVLCEPRQARLRHEFYGSLRAAGRPGLVLFSSGSSGRIKAAVHDLAKIIEKFKVPRRCFRTVTFLLYDHIGGVNTLLYTLSNSGCVVTVSDRNPAAVLEAIQKHRVELLPASPTFLRLILLSEDYKRHRLDSLKIVTYGTEPMPASTLERFHRVFPQVELLQTYGLSEVGILRSKSKSSDSLWMKIGGEGFQTRVVNGKLQIKAESAMLGYLNAPSPFTTDGWLDTGDSVITDGEYVRILGRESEIINVGGEKVYPAEVESVIQEMTNVADVTVHGDKNSILGNIVCARVTLVSEEDAAAFGTRLKRHCAERLERFKVPVRVEVVRERLHSDRIKKIRS